MADPDTAPPLVGIVVVSHSRRLAEGVVELARQMAGDDVVLEPVGGAPDGSIGTDADAIVVALRTADRGAGVLVLADLGSAVLASQTAIEMLADELTGPVRISGAPIAEGSVIAAVQASIGQTLDEVAAAADATRTMDKGTGG